MPSIALLVLALLDFERREVPGANCGDGDGRVSLRASPLWQIGRRHLAEKRWALAWAGTCTLGIALTELVKPWPLKVIFDNVLSGMPLPPSAAPLRPLLALGKAPAIVVLSSLILLIALLRGALSYSQVYVTSRIGNELVNQLRRDLFAHLQTLSLSFHSRTRSGELLTKVARDTSMVKELFAEAILTVASQVLTLAAVVVTMFLLEWRLAWIVLLTLPLLAGNLFALYRKARVSANRQRRKEEVMASRITEVIASVPLVQAFGRERYEEERFGAASDAYLEESIRTERVDAMAARAVEIITAAGTVVVILFGSLEVARGRMTIGSVLVFSSYLQAMYRPVRSLARLSTTLSKATVSAGRIQEVLATEPDIQDAPDAIDAVDLQGEIVFEHVSFRYPDGAPASGRERPTLGEPALSDVSFRIPAGHKVALIGASGAGKSTLVSLLLRFYDPAEGRVLVDGIDLRSYRRESLRRQIGLVLQGSVLFGTTVRENIAYGKLDATDEEIVAAARAAHAHEFIERLEHGYDTVLGERGGTVSGGQRQRLAIARAIVRNARILILDEPMTALDVRSEARVREALERLIEGRTCLLITHDLAAAARADRVLVLANGRLVEDGTHAELVQGSERYRRLLELRQGA